MGIIKSIELFNFMVIFIMFHANVTSAINVSKLISATISISSLVTTVLESPLFLPPSQSVLGARQPQQIVVHLLKTSSKKAKGISPLVISANAVPRRSSLRFSTEVKILTNPTPTAGSLP